MHKHIIVMFIWFLFTACNTVDRTVEQLVHQRQAVVQNSSDVYKNQFIENIRGSYQMVDGTELLVDGSGFFKIGDTEYSIHQVLNASQAVYISATLDTNKNKNVYTYHGIEVTSTGLSSVAYKAPEFSSDKPELSEKDTEHAWKVNVFQPENLNWSSRFTSQFAVKVSPIAR